MTTKNEKDRAKQIQDKCQTILTQLLKDEDNKYCVDCDAKGPRWASWNLGIFLCIRCAGIHRNLGVHISKVKSVNLDSWTPEQVVSLQQMGNSRARAVYEANLPDAFRRPQTDSALEAFVRAKYEHRKYVAREWVPPSPPKVNWDKEIDEEMERQKKKKKSTSSTTASLPIADKKPVKSEVIPQPLPKPKSSASPKPGRATPKRDSGNSVDLLGGATKSSSDLITQTQTTDDVFSGFLSAPQPASQDPNKNPKDTKAFDLKTEEESFFNQPAPSEKEKSKMTKDSILALYGQAPVQSSAQFGAPAPTLNGMFPTAFAQNQTGFSQNPGGFGQNQNAFGQNPSSFGQNQVATNQNLSGFNQNPSGFSQQSNAFSQSFGNFPQSQNSFLQNGGQSTIVPQQAPNFMGNFNQFGAAPASNAFSQFPTQGQFNVQNASQQPTFPTSFPPQHNQQSFTGAGFQNTNGAFQNGSQQFFNRQQNAQQPSSNLQQQFGGMSLSGNASAGNTMNMFANGQNLTGAFPAKTQSNMAANSVWQ